VELPQDADGRKDMGWSSNLGVGEALKPLNVKTYDVTKHFTRPLT